MENASKALLIAGAILIVILLIAVGMLVYSQSRGAIDTGVAQMSSAEIQMFNAQFTNYEGMQNKTATKNLLQIIMNNNSTYKDDKSRWIKVDFYYTWLSEVDNNRIYGHRPAGSTDYESFMNSMRRMLNDIDTSSGSKTYYIKFLYEENGLINNVEIIQSGVEEYYNKNKKKG